MSPYCRLGDIGIREGLREVCDCNSVKDEAVVRSVGTGSAVDHLDWTRKDGASPFGDSENKSSKHIHDKRHSDVTRQ